MPTTSSSTAMAATSLKLIVQKQYAGTITGHKYNLLPAVTKLHRGVRYSLSVVDRMNEHGEKDVHCVDADIVRRILDRGFRVEKWIQ